KYQYGTPLTLTNILTGCVHSWHEAAGAAELKVRCERGVIISLSAGCLKERTPEIKGLRYCAFLF
ncbi:hypothetical protein, partial [Escherichia coli]|uniref:hypothetical protein n=1 Tax=Escherichia coli TaxID=562 RepID=UPI001A7E122C